MIDPGDFITVVGSSNIKAVGYDPEEFKLYVRFAGKNDSSSLYSYEGVSQEVFDELINVESKGKFIHSEIKSNYKYAKIE